MIRPGCRRHRASASPTPSHAWHARGAALHPEAEWERGEGAGDVGEAAFGGGAAETFFGAGAEAGWTERRDAVGEEDVADDHFAEAA